MPIRTPIRGLAVRTALAATVVSLAAAAPAAGDRDQYGNNLYFSPSACNPAEAVLSVATVGVPSVVPKPVFVNGVAWVDYFGVPVAVLPPFRVRGDVIIRGWGFEWPWPSPSALPPGRYTMHALLQGSDAVYGPLLSFVFTTVSATATIDAGLGPDCTPTAAAAASIRGTATTKPPPRLLARRARAVQRISRRWLKGSHGPRAHYPKARICGSDICVKSSAGAAWQTLAGT